MGDKEYWAAVAKESERAEQERQRKKAMFTNFEQRFIAGGRRRNAARKRGNLLKCTKCEEWLPKGSYYQARGGLAGRMPRCKKCANARKKKKRTAKQGRQEERR